jgi:putative glutamine amidotransferase
VRVAVLAGREPAARYSLHRGYLDALWSLDAMPFVVVPPYERPPQLGLAALEGAEAVLLTGGGDVHPSCYRSTPVTDLMDVDMSRDAFEIAAVRWATATGRRLLGICRGAQMINVALGGNLVQDLPSAGFPGHWRLDREHVDAHAVSAEPGSAAAGALGGAQSVNSVHNQAVATPAAGLTASAWSQDGVVEAVEGDGVLGLQWHPERMIAADPRHLAAFRWLVRPAA